MVVRPCTTGNSDLIRASLSRLGNNHDKNKTNAIGVTVGESLITGGR